MDPPVLGFTAIAASLRSRAFSASIPALRASAWTSTRSSAPAGRTAGLGSGRILRNAVVVVEVALSFVLLIGSGLMVRSFIALQHTDPGFSAKGVLTFLLPLTTARSDDQAAAMTRDLRGRFAAITGVTGVTAADSMPLDGFSPLARWGTEEALTDPNRFKQGNAIVVLPGYFELLRTRLVDGRTFTEADNRPGAKLVIVDQLLAAKAYPNQRAVGKRLLARVNTPEAEWYEIVGVVAHQRHDTLAADGHEAMFYTDGFIGAGSASRWALRTEGDANRLVAQVRAEIARFDKRLAVSDIMPLETYVDKAQAQTRFALILIAVVRNHRRPAGSSGSLWRAVRCRAPEDRRDRPAHGSRRRPCAASSSWWSVRDCA